MATTRTARLSGADRRQQILQVAEKLFARQGYNGATTREISTMAKVNEAIIFRHFPTKEDLYWAVIEEQCRPGRSRTSGELQAQLHEQCDLRQFLSALACQILERDTRLTRLLLYSALENHKLSHRFFRTYVATYHEVLAEHLRKRIEKGELRKMDPLLASRGFLGMIGNHFLIQEIFGGNRYERFNVQQVAETLTDIWLNGVLTKRQNQRRNTRGSKGKKATTETAQ